MSAWISLKKQKPPSDTPVLVFVNRYVLMHVNTWKSSECWEDDSLDGFITHWMPLPDAPEDD